MANEKTNPYYEGLIESIKTTTSLIQSLNKDLKDNEISLATLKTRLDGVDDGLRNLTKLVRDGNGSNSIITRLALLEDDVSDLTNRDADFRKFVYNKVEELHDSIRKDEDKTEEKQSYGRDKVIGILKILPGVIALITVLVSMLIN